jgi:HPt (histidine-containing phosphotransfer) domain-containing protein
MYPFQFDKSIDTDYMCNMYDADYKYIEQIFSLTLNHINEDISTADQKYASTDAEGMRKAIHKIKSTFGFIGMIELQENCRKMEEKCSVYSIEEIKHDIEELLKKISIHKLILQNEYVRLKNFNSQSL